LGRGACDRSRRVGCAGHPQKSSAGCPQKSADDAGSSLLPERLCHSALRYTFMRPTERNSFAPSGAAPSPSKLAQLEAQQLLIPCHVLRSPRTRGR
jgi:hypothetical protein